MISTVEMVLLKVMLDDAFWGFAQVNGCWNGMG